MRPGWRYTPNALCLLRGPITVLEHFVHKYVCLVAVFTALRTSSFLSLLLMPPITQWNNKKPLASNESTKCTVCNSLLEQHIEAFSKQAGVCSLSMPSKACTNHYCKIKPLSDLTRQCIKGLVGFRYKTTWCNIREDHSFG